jgi:beta-galactosidase
LYQIFGNGDVLVHAKFESKGIMPRFGMQFTTLNDLTHMTWFGRGPHETYQDRQESGIIDLYSGTVEDQLYSYIIPQENANKTDVRWASWLDTKQKGFVFIGNPTLSVSAWPYSQSRLTQAKHTSDLLIYDEFLTLNIDFKQMGVGGWHCGSLPRNEYMLQPGKYEYSFLIRPYSPQNGTLKKYARIAFK